MYTPASCIECKLCNIHGELTCTACHGRKQIANLTRVEVVCFGCFAYPAPLTDRQGRPWCQTCADSSDYCLSCGESRREVGRQLVGNVEACNRCAHKVVTEEIVTVPTCEVCGEPLEDDQPGRHHCEGDPFAGEPGPPIDWPDDGVREVELPGIGGTPRYSRVRLPHDPRTCDC